jgi:hypothetical protein
MANTSVVTVCMRDYCALNRSPGINIKIARWAIQALRTVDDQRLLDHRSPTRFIAAVSLPRGALRSL